MEDIEVCRGKGERDGGLSAGPFVVSDIDGPLALKQARRPGPFSWATERTWLTGGSYKMMDRPTAGQSLRHRRMTWRSAITLI